MFSFICLLNTSTEETASNEIWHMLNPKIILGFTRGMCWASPVHQLHQFSSRRAIGFQPTWNTTFLFGMGAVTWRKVMPAQGLYSSCHKDWHAEIMQKDFRLQYGDKKDWLLLGLCNLILTTETERWNSIVKFQTYKRLHLKILGEFYQNIWKIKKNTRCWAINTSAELTTSNYWTTIV